MPGRTTSRAAERREQRKQDILDAASRLFAEKGYDSVTLRAVADDLGYAHAALYRYFPNKFSVLAEICRRTFAQLLTEVSSFQQRDDKQEALFDTARRFVKFATEQPHHFRTVFMGSGQWGDVESGRYIDAVGQDCFRALIGSFQAAWKTCHETDGLLQAQAWWISLFGTAQVFLASPEDARLLNREDLLELQLEALWRGLQVGAPERGRGKAGLQPNP